MRNLFKKLKTKIFQDKRIVEQTNDVIKGDKPNNIFRLHKLPIMAGICVCLSAAIIMSVFYIAQSGKKKLKTAGGSESYSSVDPEISSMPEDITSDFEESALSDVESDFSEESSNKAISSKFSQKNSKASSNNKMSSSTPQNGSQANSSTVSSAVQQPVNNFKISKIDFFDTTYAYNCPSDDVCKNGKFRFSKKLGKNICLKHLAITLGVATKATPVYDVSAYNEFSTQDKVVIAVHDSNADYQYKKYMVDLKNNRILEELQQNIVAINQNGSKYVVLGSNDRTVQLYDVGTKSSKILSKAGFAPDSQSYVGPDWYAFSPLQKYVFHTENARSNPMFNFKRENQEPVIIPRDIIGYIEDEKYIASRDDSDGKYFLYEESSGKDVFGKVTLNEPYLVFTPYMNSIHRQYGNTDLYLKRINMMTGKTEDIPNVRSNDKSTLSSDGRNLITYGDYEDHVLVTEINTLKQTKVPFNDNIKPKIYAAAVNSAKVSRLSIELDENTNSLYFFCSYK